MEDRNQLESIVKLRQRFLRLIKLAEPNSSVSNFEENISTDGNFIDLTGQIEDFVRQFFANFLTVEQFIFELQRTLNVTIKNNLALFLEQTVPLAQNYLKSLSHDPFSWDVFKSIQIQPSTMVRRCFYRNVSFPNR